VDSSLSLMTEQVPPPNKDQAFFYSLSSPPSSYPSRTQTPSQKTAHHRHHSHQLCLETPPPPPPLQYLSNLKVKASIVGRTRILKSWNQFFFSIKLAKIKKLGFFMSFNLKFCHQSFAGRDKFT